MSGTPEIKSFFDEPTNTASHIAFDPETRACAVIDSVLDYDIAAGRTDTGAADVLIEYIRSENLNCEWILETHVHADHLSAAPYIQQILGGKMAIGAHITVVQDTFGKIFNAGTEFERDGSQFDRLLEDGDTFKLGTIDVRVMHTPGHTPACITYVMGDAAFVGDTLFMPDYGTARADFPGGCARELYRSIHKVLSLPPHTRLYLCHDYKAPGRDEYVYVTTVAEELESNVHVGGGVSEDEFVAMREARDKTLGMPKLIIPSIQINMRAGNTPPPEDDGNIYLKVPLNRL